MSTSADAEIEKNILELRKENIDFTINVNNIIGNLGLTTFNAVINAMNTAVFILQKEGVARHTYNITRLTNKILQSEGCLGHPYKVNRAEVISMLYFIQQNLETIYIDTGVDELPTWSMRQDVFDHLYEDD